uniref:Uncharacterized protein n=1 Tax=Caenorhabditis tropicalis TaxID=1561998 RepID=A0A1I7U887_9PELO
MLARFSHDNASETREMSGVFKDAKTINEKAKTNVKVNEKTKDSYGYRENLRCLVWYSDTLSLEEPNPKFYLYNYITTLRRAPLLADALTTPPVEKKANDSDVTEYTQARKLYVTEKEPYKDGTHENDEDYRTFHFEVKQDRLNNGKSFIMAIGGTISFLILLAITIAFLVVLCQKVQDHSSFSRSDDIRAQRRFDRCFKSPQLPKEFIKKNYEERKKTDVEAGPSIK